MLRQILHFGRLDHDHFARMAKPMRNFDMARLSRVLESIYSVSTGQLTWPEALADFGECFPDVRIALAGYEGRLENTNVLAHANFEESFIHSYVEYYHKLNPWADLLMRAPAAPALVWGHDFVPLDELSRTEFYADWVRPQDDIATGFASTLFRERDRYVVIAANVSPDRLEQGREAAEAFKLVGPHLQRSFELWRRLEGNAFQQATATAVLDRLSAAVLVVDAAGKVTLKNRKAEELCREGRILRVMRDATLRFLPHENQLAVEAHFASIQHAGAPAQPMLLRLRSGEAPLALFIAPMAEARDGGPARGYLFFIIDLSREPLPRSEAVARSLGVTSTEALLARALLEDKTIADYADERGISRHTARAQLKSLMQKTDTKRQSELVNLLTRLFGIVDFEP